MSSGRPAPRLGKGQITAEFTVSILAMVLILGIAMVFIYGQSTNLFAFQDTLAARYSAQKLAFAMNQVYLSGNGAQYNVTLETTGIDNITIDSGHVTVKKPMAVASYAIMAQSVNASTIGGTAIRIVNRNGVLGIEPA